MMYQLGKAFVLRTDVKPNVTMYTIDGFDTPNATVHAMVGGMEAVTTAGGAHHAMRSIQIRFHPEHLKPLFIKLAGPLPCVRWPWA